MPCGGSLLRLLRLQGGGAQPPPHEPFITSGGCRGAGGCGGAEFPRPRKAGSLGGGGRGGGRLRGDGQGGRLWLVVEAAQHLRRGDLPAQPVARCLEDDVGIGLVDGPHGKAPVQHLVKVHSGSLWGIQVESGLIGFEAQAQYLEHLVLDEGEKAHVDVEDVVYFLLELPGVR